MIHITPAFSIDEREIAEEFVRAGGPGGQNVNKVATAVKLRFAAASSPSLPEHVRRRLATLAGRRMSAEGVLVIDARRFRTQEANRRDALDRLVALIRAAAVVPRPRHATRPTAASRRRRILSKRLRSAKKAMRNKSALEEP